MVAGRGNKTPSKSYQQNLKWSASTLGDAHQKRRRRSHPRYPVGKHPRMRRAGQPGDEPAGPDSIQQVLTPNPNRDAPTDTLHKFRRGNGNGEIITAPSFVSRRGAVERAPAEASRPCAGEAGEEVAEETRGRG